MAIVESGTQALRLGSLNVGTEFTTSSVYTSDTGAYFLLPTAYTALSGLGFDPEGPGQVPTAGAIAGWAKYSYDGTPHYTFSGLNVPVGTWTDAVDENDTTAFLTVALSGDDELTGGALADELFGFAGDDTLDGAGGNDTLRGDAGDDDLDGGSGADAMTGGAGNDTYAVDNVGDRVTEQPNEGTDDVSSTITYTLGANVDNLTLAGTGAINGTGNGDANTLTGNDAANALAGGAGADTLVGNGGNDALNGGAGVDTMTGGAGNDSYIVDTEGETVSEDADQGIDAVQSAVDFTLGANVEHLTLTGTAAVDASGNAESNTLTGNAAANVLSGAAGADTLRGEAGNDVLNGGAGADAMAGGTGDDFYVVEENGDTVTEALNAGTDTVQSAVEFRLGANVENLTLTGAGDIDGFGNTLANILIGNTGQNELNGGTGADMMFGGGGDDGYFVDSAGDRVVEIASGGSDTVTSTISHTLATNVEKLMLGGTAAINGTGNAGNNTLTGNVAVNTLVGGDGVDTLLGNAGNDTLRGDAGADSLDGGAGADAMAGGADNDTYFVDNAGDRVSELAPDGVDTVSSTVTHTLGANVENLTLTGTAAINGTGNDLANELTGNAAANTLNGAAGADRMIGGGGNDVYVVDETADVVDEAALGGTDAVQSSATFILGNNVENLTLTGTAPIDGTGNAEGNALTGNSAANRLSGAGGVDTLLGNAGDDSLDGGAGDDTMEGGAGNDTYIVDGADTVTEVADAGNDSVTSSIDYTLLANVENLTLTGTATNATGNDLANTLTGNDVGNELSGEAGNDVLDGDAGADTLDGGPGADTMAGGDDDDAYVVDDAGDIVTEDADVGNDSVTSSIDYTLLANVENLTLTGTAATGAGNAGPNFLSGNDQANTLSGGDGNDILAGGAGDDVLLAGTGDDGIAGGDGADTIDGGAGMDTMEGGAGADTFAFALGFGEDTIGDWLVGDQIELDTDLGPANFAALDTNTSNTLDDDDALVAISGTDTVIDFGSDVLTIEAVTDLDASDFVFVA